ncbi:beta-ketoacyl synthase N-terminal-like domain-containing protein [Lentzea sp. CA-135723]|uniref:beta-ketoacyl synthase N-terminal-like domain-containing protein n=1 Tax=Lentzea sp. CA-135723 TaxID=3239950 RepID=UPI003D92556A
MVSGTLVTGMAWHTPLGDDLDGVWARLCAGETGVAPVPSAHRLRSDLAATVPAVASLADPVRRQHVLAVTTLRAVFENAGLHPADPDVTVVLGTSFGATLDARVPLSGWAERAAEEAGHPMRPLTVTTACSAASDSVAVAHALIRSGHSRICVAGGVDVITDAKRLGHTALGTMSPTSTRAFDRAHDGMTLGEGAGLLVLESEESAAQRGARVLARLRGTGAANDASGLTAPDTSGASVKAALRRCLAAAGSTPQDVAVVNVHGTGTPLNDSVEISSLQDVFGTRGPTLFGTKGAFGHSLGATGGIEAIATVLALRNGVVPPVHGLRDPVPELTLPVPIRRARPIGRGAGMSVTLGFGGFDTCLLFDLPGGDR